MPLTPIITPQFPDVPAQQGVPPIFRASNQLPVQNLILLASDALNVLGMFAAPQWGVFTEDGFPVALADSVISVDYRREWRISDYPLEQGGFESYDKVALPFDVRVRFAISGTIDAFGISSSRPQFLEQIDEAAKSLDLFTVVTPDKTYFSANIVHYDYRREAKNGVSLMTVDVWLEEVRVTVQAEFSNTATPDGEAKQDNGPTQAANPVDTGRDVVGTPNAAVADPTGPPPANPLPVDTGRDVVGTPSVGSPDAVVTTNYQGQVVEVPPVAPPAAASGILDQDSWKFMVN